MYINHNLTGAGAGLGAGGGGLFTLVEGGASSSEVGGDISSSLFPSEIT